MIGCDECDDWYHWSVAIDLCTFYQQEKKNGFESNFAMNCCRVCVGIRVPPAETENWYCQRCIAKKQGSLMDKKKGRKKKSL